MTDLAVRTSTTDLMAFAEEAGQVHKIAQALAGTSFVPKQFQGRPDEITGAILFGRELNVDPMTALQIITVIQGRPTISANGMRGLAMAAGVVFQVVEQTDTRVVMRARSPQQDHWTGSTWTIDRAKKMGLTSKDNWQKQPQAMLVARCTSELCRLVAANVLLGLPYSTEELRDLGEVEPDPQQPEPEKKTRTVKRAPVQAYAPPSEPEPEPVADQPKEIGYSIDDDEKRTAPEDPPAREAVDVNTRKALMAGFNDLNIRDRTARLAYVSAVVGREVHSVNQLNEAEARQVISMVRDDLAAKGWPEPAEVPA